jgi:hypothetical protein
MQIYREGKEETEIETRRKYYSPEEMKRILVNAGFKKIKFSKTYNYYDFNNKIIEDEMISNFLIKAVKE